MEAIILAGGLGTRLQSVVKGVPKPMADINGKPFLSYLINYLHGFGVDRIILSVGYKKEAVKSYFKKFNNNIAIEYCDEDMPLGTGGAFKKAFGLIKEQNFFLINGDTLFRADLASMAQAHIDSGALITMALKPMERFDRYGCVKLDGGVIISFEEKKYCESGLINGGVYMLNEKVAETLNDLSDIFSFEKDFLEVKIANIKPRGFVDDGYFVDIGVPQDYERAKKELNDYI